MVFYIKNLVDTIDDKREQPELAPQCKFTNAKVTMKHGSSGRFGFDYFSLPEEVTKAAIAMNGRVLVSKLLYVAFAQRHEDRKVHYMDRVGRVRMQSSPPVYSPQIMQMQHSFPAATSVVDYSFSASEADVICSNKR